MPAPTRTTNRTAAAIAAIAIGVLPLAACGGDEVAEPADPVVTAPEVDETDQAGVGEEGDGGAAQDSLEGRLGEQVELTAEVADLLPPNALTVGGDTIGENPILVVGADVPADLTAGDTVMITGTVTEFQVPGFEEDLDLDLIDQEFEDFDGDPAIQATSVTVA